MEAVLVLVGEVRPVVAEQIAAHYGHVVFRVALEELGFEPKKPSVNLHIVDEVEGRLAQIASAGRPTWTSRITFIRVIGPSRDP